MVLISSEQIVRSCAPNVPRRELVQMTCDHDAFDHSRCERDGRKPCHPDSCGADLAEIFEFRLRATTASRSSPVLEDASARAAAYRTLIRPVVPRLRLARLQASARRRHFDLRRGT